MKLNNLRQLVKEELKRALSENKMDVFNSIKKGDIVKYMGEDHKVVKKEEATATLESVKTKKTKNLNSSQVNEKVRRAKDYMNEDNSSEINLEIHRYGTTTPIVILKPRERVSVILLSNILEMGEWTEFNFSSSSGGGGGSSLIEAILNLEQYPNEQNPFSIGDIATYNPDIIAAKWDKGLSNNFNAEVLGVIASLSGRAITIQTSGLVSGFTGLISGKKYYLSPTIPGTLTDDPGIFNIPILIANSESTGYLIQNDPNSRFNRKSIITLGISSSYKLTQGNYSFAIDGYVVGDHRDISFNGNIYSGTPSDATIITQSEYIINSDTPGFLCIYQLDNDIYIKNNLNISINVMLNIRGSL
jgi:hypothetical protein